MSEAMNDNSIVPVLFSNKKDCCGCGACFIVCPVKAIIMNEDERGFVYPIIDVNKCVSCKRCIKICVFRN